MGRLVLGMVVVLAVAGGISYAVAGSRDGAPNSSGPLQVAPTGSDSNSVTDASL